ncbi:MAG: hypothetical protein LBG99_08225 [Propionibacteriaceae bacterium]|jgi:hypothetical protein|nr:hypothetical protein [Propionibacteriaceae bacterium]
MRRISKNVWVAGVLAVALVLVGCALVEEGQTDNSSGPPQTLPSHTYGKLGELQDCLEDAGWEIIYSGGTIEGPTLPKEQVPLYESDEARCAEQVGFNDPLTAEDYHRLYPLEVANHLCLLEHGYDSAEPPSEQQFVEDWLAQSPSRKPYQSVELVFHGPDFIAATDACPPPLWGF